jgi:multidrug efflux pump subunit AcrA (membrane-fusion protein)
MVHGEKTWLFVGLVIGFATALIVFVVMNRTPAVPPIAIDHTHEQPPFSILNDDTSLNDGTSQVVQLTADEEEKIGLQISAVRRNAVSTEIVTLGRVEEVGAAIHTISARSGGRIEHIFVNTGQLVEKGQPVAMIVSPEQSAGTTIYTESTGIVRTLNVAEGRFVSPGEVLAVLADLSTVLVKADVFESDIAGVRLGVTARISSEALPREVIGVVKLIDSRSDQQTGSTPVRIQVQNPGMRLKPGMFVRCVLQVPLSSDVLTVQRTSVIDTGMDKIVYVALGRGVFERRSIRVGTPGKDLYPVVAGLAEGDKVVTNGAFLIDSQARITRGITTLYGDSKSFNERLPVAPPPGGAFSFTFRTSPEPPAPGIDNRAHVTVLDSAGKPVSDAEVRITAVMPAMPSMGMPEMRDTADLHWDGSEYMGQLKVGMAGPWNVIVEARRNDQLLATYRTRFDVH